jgi:hypothetical protein
MTKKECYHNNNNNNDDDDDAHYSERWVRDEIKYLTHKTASNIISIKSYDIARCESRLLMMQQISLSCRNHSVKEMF